MSVTFSAHVEVSLAETQCFKGSYIRNSSGTISHLSDSATDDGGLFRKEKEELQDMVQIVMIRRG